MVSVRITYTRPSELRDDVGQPGGAVLVKIDETADLAFDMPLAIELVTPDGAVLRGQAKVLQVLAGFGVAVSIDGALLEEARRRAVGDDPPGALDARHERVDRRSGTFPPRRLPTEPPVRPSSSSSSSSSRTSRPASEPSRTATSSRPPADPFLDSSRTKPAGEPSRTAASSRPPVDPFLDSSRTPPRPAGEPSRTATSSRPPVDPFLESSRTTSRGTSEPSRPSGDPFEPSRPPSEPSRTATTSRPPVEASRTATSTRRPGEYSSRPPIETARTATVSRPPVEARTQTPRTPTSSRPPDLALGSTPSQQLPDRPVRPPSEPAARPPSEPPARPPTEPPGADDEPPASEEDDDRPRRPESKQYNALTHAEKIQLALHGSRDDRAAILRDKNRTLHPFVLKNPQIDIDDVTMIAKNPQMAAEILKQVADRREWFQRPAIAVALARNPKTPPEVAIRALDHVPTEALRQMAKGAGVLPHVAQAARKKVLG